MTGLVVLAGLLMASPSLFAALTGTGDVDTALLHLALALLVAAVGGRLVRNIFLGYAEPAAGAGGSGDALRKAGRRRSDAIDPTA
ncbi:hypothetical protein CLV92_10736 [Kineococcus xinjiangensis]|uniref:Uncharacterized protein n=1 Tax=Kineococcus xinjiangensis TaxID=512762 RepID=A0A2S6IJX8_9ACTN|nr:hypothetical protein [Kineococcus xinjiangensis]PPK94534.1 hypothetical protein CLV92_10736 [Kineococcus xinjiangensis]